MFQNGTNHFFFEFTGFEDVFKVLGDGRTLHPEQLGNPILSQPDRFVVQHTLHLHLTTRCGIPVCILVLKKCKKPDDVLFINAAEHFTPGKRQNQLSKDHIRDIIEAYQHRTEKPRYSRRVEMAEIEKNDFNLNISRYISTAIAEAEIDLASTHDELVKIEESIRNAASKHNEFLSELGLPPLPL